MAESESESFRAPAVTVSGRRRPLGLPGSTAGNGLALTEAALPAAAGPAQVSSLPVAYSQVASESTVTPESES